MGLSKISAKRWSWRLTPANAATSLRLFEELSKRHPPTSDEQFLLAQLYTADNNWTDARNLFQNLLARNAENTLYLSYYIDNLLRHGEIDPASLLLDKLEQREPGAFRTVELKARLLEARGQRSEAIAVLTSYAQTKDAPLGLIAVSLDSLGEAAAAETMYRTFVAQSHQPASVLTFAAFLGRQGQIEKALDLCTSPGRRVPLTRSVSPVWLYSARPESKTSTTCVSSRNSRPRSRNIPRRRGSRGTWHSSRRIKAVTRMPRRFIAVSLNWIRAMSPRSTTWPGCSLYDRAEQRRP